MNRETYQAAFSWLEPSASAVEKAVTAGSGQKKTHCSVRLGTVLAAAALAVVLLTGAAFAANELHWFSLGSGDSIVIPANTDPEQGPDARSVLNFDMAKSDTRIGFRLPESYETDKAALECRMLSDGLYQRYYRAADLKDPDCPLLTVEILDNGRTAYQTYFTCKDAELVKQERWNGMETVWLRINDSEFHRTEYCLFRMNEDLGCIAAVNSTVSFAEAEQAALDLTFEDSGIPVPPAGQTVYYGMRLGWIPEGMTVDHHESLADRWYVVNATRRDPEQDLAKAWTVTQLTCQEGTKHISIAVEIDQDLDRFYNSAPVEYGTVYQTGTICSNDARWVHASGDSAVVQVYLPEYRVMLSVWIDCTDMNDSKNILPDDSWVEKAEQILANIEIVEVPLAEEAPVEYVPFGVG